MMNITILMIPIALLFLLVPVPLGLLVVFGGWRMMQGKSYSLAVTAAILALLPCNPFSLLGLIFGVWSLVVLSRPNVKSAFEQFAERPPQNVKVAKA